MIGSSWYFVDQWIVNRKLFFSTKDKLRELGKKLWEVSWDGVTEISENGYTQEFDATKQILEDPDVKEVYSKWAGKFTESPFHWERPGQHDVLVCNIVFHMCFAPPIAERLLLIKFFANNYVVSEVIRSPKVERYLVLEGIERGMTKMTIGERKELAYTLAINDFGRFLLGKAEPYEVWSFVDKLLDGMGETEIDELLSKTNLLADVDYTKELRDCVFANGGKNASTLSDHCGKNHYGNSKNTSEKLTVLKGFDKPRFRIIDHPFISTLIAGIIVAILSIFILQPLYNGG